MLEVRILAAELVEECASCYDCRKVCFFDATENRIDRCRVVQVHGRLSCAENRHNAECGIAASREHETYVLVVLGDGLDDSSEVVAESDHSVAVHMAASRVNQDGAGTALAHGAEPKRDDGRGMVHGEVPDVGGEKLQIFADGLFGRCRWNCPAKSDADGAVEVLRAVHAFRGLAVAAAPKTVDVERNNLGFGSFDSLGIIERKFGNEWSLCDFAFGENDDSFAFLKSFVDLRHGGFGVAAIDVDERFPVRKPTQIPVCKCVSVAGDEERARACHLENGPINKAEMRAYQKERTRFGDVLYAVNLDLVTEDECECKAESCAQECHRGAHQREHERQRKNQGEEEKLFVETQFRRKEEYHLESEQDEKESHLDHERNGVNASRGVRACHALDDCSKDDKCATGPECNKRIEEGEDVLVAEKRRYEHRDGRGYSGNGDKACFHKVL